MSIRHPTGIISSNTQNYQLNTTSTSVGKVSLSYQIKNSKRWPFVKPTTSDVVAFGILAAPYAGAYSWNDSTGFGAKYSDPSGLNGCRAVRFFPDGKTIAFADYTHGGISCFKWSSSGGFGTKYNDPEYPIAGSASSFGLYISPQGDYVINGLNTDNYMGAWRWDNDTGFGQRYIDPNPIVAAAINDVDVSPDRKYVLTALTSTTGLGGWQWNEAEDCGFGNRLANPTTAVGSAVYSVKFNSTGTHVVIGFNTSPYLAVYTFTAGVVGTRTTVAASVGVVNDVCFSPDNSVLFTASANSPRINAYAWDGSNIGTKYANPTTLPTGSGNGIAINRQGTAVVLTGSLTPYIHAYAWNNSTGFGTKYSNPATLPGTALTKVSFN